MQETTTSTASASMEDAKGTREDDVEQQQQQAAGLKRGSAKPGKDIELFSRLSTISRRSGTEAQAYRDIREFLKLQVEWAVSLLEKLVKVGDVRKYCKQNEPQLSPERLVTRWEALES